MQWTAVMCSTDLGWEAWLALCVAIAGLWAVAIAGAIALFGASTRKPTERGPSEDHDAKTDPHPR
ncbi:MULTISPECIES: hypothetical protein [Mycolicibacterium]|jgi:hypothetical protein|uniref:Uncharacterized protein n=1 Tax=Mycolicibacterium austroafricanum TaxID=39687 RepID=A0ABT8HNL4_MYCAO|nr:MULTISPECIES: hypothetical protein [Mycolicibacterium]MCV7131276.1 hypothetical protein [Mycolicibacterium vanbaalenii PYR-1]MDN4522348.1 hypothetical protein [Mycolicibacterium austroafricanum]MDW5613929.1 hypothetical protein [Mycolicibacterium sp. D5.8-2]PQP52790.1 hypothetical protein C6A88_05015 [Mycolicibacterium austroafricanum]QRZ08466.1 hypothetical protein JN090_08095 [Mycolicibacterium austroafricanum]